MQERAAFCGVLPWKVETTRKNIYWFKKNRYVNRWQVKWQCSFFPWESTSKSANLTYFLLFASSPENQGQEPRNCLDTKWAWDHRYGNEIQGERQQHLNSAHTEGGKYPQTSLLTALKSKKNPFSNRVSIAQVCLEFTVLLLYTASRVLELGDPHYHAQRRKTLNLNCGSEEIMFWYNRGFDI